MKDNRLWISVGAVLLILVAFILILSRDGGDSTPDSSTKANVSTKAEIRSTNAAPEILEPIPEERVAKSTEKQILSTNDAATEQQEKDVYRGRVIEFESKAPVADVTVEAYLFRNGVYEIDTDYPERIGEAHTDTQGYFAFPREKIAGNETLSWRVEVPGFSSRIRLFPAGKGIDNEVLSTFQLEYADSISGVVVDQNGERIAGALVGQIVLEDTVGGKVAAGPGAYTSAWTRTFADGTFILEGIPLPDRDPKRIRDAREYRLPASADGYTKGYSAEVKAGDRDVQIELHRGEASLSGVVLDAAGKTVAGAEVSLLAKHAYDKPLTHDAATDAEGSFTFPALAAGAYTLSATKLMPEALGFPPRVDQEVVLLLDQHKTVRLQFPFPTEVSGRFVDQDTNTGIPGVTIFSRIDDVEAREVAEKVTSDDQGRFALELYLPPVEGKAGFSPRLPIALPLPYQVSSGAGSSLYTLNPDALTLLGLQSGNDRKNLLIPLAAGVEVTGIVLEPESTIPAAEVPVFYRGDAIYGDTMTNTAGRFQFYTRPGAALEMEASSERGIAAIVAQAPEPNQKGNDVLIQLEEYATISGTVLDADESPLPEEELQVGRSSGPGQPESSIRFPENGITDENGVYTIRKVAPGNIEVRLAIPPSSEFALPEPKRLALQPGEERTGVDFVLSRGDFIEGYVYDTEDEPIPGVTLFSDMVNLSAATDESGYFRIAGVPVDTALTHLTAVKEGYQEETKRSVSIYDRDLVFRLSPTGEIEVRVVDAHSRPTTNYRLRLLGEREGFQRTERALIHDVVVTDPSGETTLASIGSGEFRLEAERLGPDGQPTFERAAQDFHYDPASDGARSFTLSLSDGLLLSGFVVAGETGDPVSGAAVELINVPPGLELPGASFSGPPYRRVATFVADGAGAFAIGPLPAGEYQIAANKGNLATEARLVSLTEGMDPIEIALEPSPVIRGRILGVNGELVESATVFFARGEDPPMGEPLNVSGGTFEKRLEGAGSWRVIASENNTQNNGMVRVELAPGEQKDVVVDFSGRVTLSGQILANGQPAEDVGVILVSGNGNESFIEYIHDGSGSYRAKVYPGMVHPVLANGLVRVPLGESFSVNESPEEQTRDITVDLTEIDLVVDSGADPFPGGQLSLYTRLGGAEVPVMNSYTLDRNSLRFFRLPAGTYQARLQDDGRTIGTSGWTEAGSGRENVLVVIVE